MPSLKTFRLRIRSVQSTQKITKAMKMVAAAKLRRAQEQAMAARPYAEAMDKILASLGASFKGGTGPRLLAGTGSDKVHLLIVATADRGLCGGFNSTIVREARRTIRALLAEGKTVKVFCVGRKGRDQLRRDFAGTSSRASPTSAAALSFGDAQKVAARVMEMFAAGEFDVASVVFNRFKSAMTQIVTSQQLIPPPAPEAEPAAAPATMGGAVYEFEPDEARSWPTCCRATSPSSSSASCWRTRRASTARR
jgi:F-type H+-transporting ATPase subunit gamma